MGCHHSHDASIVPTALPSATTYAAPKKYSVKHDSSKMTPTNSDDSSVDSVRGLGCSYEAYFSKFREGTSGDDVTMFCYHLNKSLPCVYADWTASGRCYKPIEDIFAKQISPYVANTHTETSFLGHVMTATYKKARQVIKRHVHATEDDVLLTYGSGMTGALYKFQSILGLKYHESLLPELKKKAGDDLPIVFITHYEHHSNQISWENCLAEVVIVPPDADGRVSIEHFEHAFVKYSHRTRKMASVSACSNVTGICTPFHAIAKVAHKHGVLCFVDFACSFGYVDVDMHPDDPQASLDAIFCSPHKLLGGPGSCGICIFNKSLYKLTKPDFCGGGTVTWTNPWGEQGYINNIEEREDGGTPAFLQTIRAAMAIQLKEEMTVSRIQAREHYINRIVFDRWGSVENIEILAGNIKDRVSVFSIIISGLHYNLLAKLLNDYFGIQCRGGCNCAGTYGHVLFDIEQAQSKSITNLIDKGDNSTKPGWCRLSFHPIMTDAEVHFICDSVIHIAKEFKQMRKEYYYDSHCNQFNFTCSCRGEKKVVTAKEQEVLIHDLVNQVLR